MRIEDERESENVEDRRGMSGLPVGGRGLGVGAVLIALVASYFLGIDPGVVLGLLQGTGPQAPVAEPGPAPRPPEGDQKAIFVSRVLASTEDAWAQIFSESGRQYPPPKLVLFSGAYPTACGMGQAAAGPFYCPGDRKVYIDLGFYQVMRDRFHASGDFAQAYVIAHEVGHHVQAVLGITEQMERRRAGSSREGAGGLSVRLELQADCLAGVWANRTDRTKHFLDPGDVEGALEAAAAIGDDALQRQSQGQVVPDSFTHGTSAQRVRWLRRGLESGDPKSCDTFNAAQL